MPVFECRSCDQSICHLFVESDDCIDPNFCPWNHCENVAVWRRLVVNPLPDKRDQFGDQFGEQYQTAVLDPVKVKASKKKNPEYIYCE
jgi:hypothetical protein